MGTGNSHTDEDTEWLKMSVIAAHQGSEALRALWERLAATGKLPEDIDISDPDTVDWERSPTSCWQWSPSSRCWRA